MRSLFYNAEPTTDLERHPTGFDREYDADSHSAFFEPLFGSGGVLLSEEQEDPCKIYSLGGGVLGIHAGTAYVKGRMVTFDGSETLEASAGYVVARMNKSVEVRAFQFLIVDEPVQEDGDIYDLPLAKITYAGQAVTVTDQRVYLTAKVMGGHHHSAEDVDGVAGHKHSAADITSGVLATARVPYQVDSERIVAKIMGVSFNAELAAKNTIYTFNVPFNQSLASIPKRVHLVITGGMDTGVDPDKIDIAAEGKTTMIDLMVSADGAHIEGYVEGTCGDAITNGSEPYYTHVRRYYRNLDAGVISNNLPKNFPLKYQGHKASTTRPKYWSGHGGAAFFQFEESFTAYIGGFQISKSGVSFKMCRSTDVSQYYGFTVSGYVFN